MGRKQTNILPRASCARMLATKNNRVSTDAAQKLVELLEETAQRIGTKAVRNALHAGRKTVQGQDIELAFRE